MNSRQRQTGAALIVSLILLVVVTVLAITGMNTATTELAMARNDQSYENAFQAAETGLEIAVSQGQFSTAAPVVMAAPITANESYTATIAFDTTTQVPADNAYSLGFGGGGLAAYHFRITSTAQSKPGGNAGPETDRDAVATHSQSFYVVGPQDPALIGGAP